MAGRTTTSLGVGATITVLSLTTLGFFVAFAVFYGKYNTSVRDLNQARADQQDIVQGAERNRDDIRNLVEQAKQERKSLVAYLVESREAIMTKVTGAGRDKLSDIEAKIPDSKDQSLLALISSLQAERKSLGERLTQADAARVAALADRQNEIERVASIDKRHQDTLATINSDVGKMKAENDLLRSGTDDYKKRVDAQLDSVKQEAAENEARLKKSVEELSKEKLILEQQLAALRGQKNQVVLRPNNEAALVDAEIIGIDSAENHVFISIGRKQNVVLGMTFAVYSTAAQIRPSEDGTYPSGKATLEVVSVGESSSTCRITSEARGNPVVKGDVVANAVYDPNKKYTFVVFGNFDANRDGIPTALERDDIATMIQDWGGKLSDDLTGDVDFLVLGERPVLPARPDSAAPFEVVQEFRRRQRDVERYDALFRQAQATSVPILNENRLYTLTGKVPAMPSPVAGR